VSSAESTGTTHFNALTPEHQEALVILAEECAEVVQCVSKILRHGLHSNNKGQLAETNVEALQREYADVLHAANRLHMLEVINLDACFDMASDTKPDVAKYLHHNSK
jgi:hypothetical protein